MPGLGPGIHAFGSAPAGVVVDGRAKPGHDGLKSLAPNADHARGRIALSGVDLRPKSRTATGRRLQGSLVPIFALRLRMCTRKVKENGRWREA